MTIKAPFNFVPLNKKVVYPYWADSVSHDVPFSDGQSGCLELEIEAISPIFVRNGQKQGSAKQGSQPQPSAADAKTQTQQDFSNDQGKYFLPGTSIKGAVRSVLEIMSFSKLADKVNDHQYSFRDLYNDDYVEVLIKSKINAGWLKYDKDNGQYTIEDAGSPGRIKHTEIDSKYKNIFKNGFSNVNNWNSDEVKSAYYKYKTICENIPLEGTFEEDFVDHNRIFYKYSGESGSRGRLVFTGQPGKPGDKSKNSEFIFFEKEPAISIGPFYEDDTLIRNFKFAYFDHDREKQSIDWKYWKSKLTAGEKIPVFFLKKGNTILHMGLSYLYKLPYNSNVRQSIDRLQEPTHHKLDFSQTIFGHALKSLPPLKGRVTFSHAYTTNAKLLPEKKEVLGSPKASYYPLYIRQNGAKFLTFMDHTAEISGWKRYPVRMGSNTKSNQSTAANDRVATHFVPIQQGAIFRCKVNYHNLRTIELGALLSALTFHQTPNAFHSIGMAKPLGYGKVKVSIVGLDQEYMNSCLRTYEAFMENELKGSDGKHGWRDSKQLKELLTMAVEPTQDNHLAYMGLKQHQDVKKGKESFKKYSEMPGSQTPAIPSFIKKLNEDIAATQREKERFEQKNIPLDDINSQLKQAAVEEFQQAREALINKWQQILQTIKVQLSHDTNTLIQLRDKQKGDKIKGDRTAEARESGPNWESFKEEINDFDSLSKFVKRFLEDYYRTDNETTTPQTTPPFPPEFSDQLVVNIKEVFTGLNKKAKNKWVEKNSAQFKKFEQWLGEEKATEIIESLKRSLDGTE